MEDQLVGENIIEEVFPDLPKPEQFPSVFESFAGENDGFAVVAISVDDFDTMLDNLGDNITSSVVLRVARIVGGLAKTNPMIWGRMSQSTFGCLCRNMDETGATKLAKEVQGRLRLTGKETVSIGVAVHPFWPFEKASTLENAKKALDHAAFFGPDTITPFDAVSLNISADKLYQYGDVDGAVDEFKRALAVDPENVNVHNSLGVCYGVQGRFDLAVDAFETAIRLDPQDVMATYNLGLAHLKEGNQAKALDLFLGAHALDGENPDVAYQIGMCYREQKRLDDALEYFEKAAANNRKGGHVFRALGDCYSDKKMLHKAAKAYERSIRENPRDARTLSALGYLYGTLGENLEIAVVLCRESTTIDPDNGTYRYRLGKLYLQGEEYENALKEFEAAAALGEDCTDLVNDTKLLMEGSGTDG